MRPSVLAVSSIVALALLAAPASAQQRDQGQAAKQKLYNTAKQKLLEGKQVFSFTQSKFDIPAYCEAAKHYDYTWFEMQHSTLEFKDVEAMIAACPHAGAIPMIRLPDAQEWHIQHATDIGALGVIIPTVDDVDRAREAAKWARYPPVARRSAGSGQAREHLGHQRHQLPADDQRQHAGGGHDRNADRRGQCVRHRVGAGRGCRDHRQQRSERRSPDFAQTDDRYQAMVTKVHDDTLRAGKIFGQANAMYDKGHPLSKDAKFFQNGPSNDGWVPPAEAGAAA